MPRKQSLHDEAACVNTTNIKVVNIYLKKKTITSAWIVLTVLVVVGAIPTAVNLAAYEYTTC